MPIYHVWFSTKGRRWLLQGELVDACKALIEETAIRHHINLLECEAIVDHVHLLVECDQGQLSNALNLIKGASARRMFERFPDLKLDAATNHFWQAGFGSRLVWPESLASTRQYVRSQWDRLDAFDKPNRLGS